MSDVTELFDASYDLGLGQHLKVAPVITQEVKKKITQNVRKFDLHALIDLLRFYGFDQSSIQVEGHVGFESQPSVIKGISFDSDNHEVTIALYMGLASANGYLPSYFFRMVDNYTFDESHFHDLVGFFDQYLLKSWLSALMPDLSILRVSQFNWIKSMASFTSLAHLQHLFQIVFPELQVRCERNEVDHSVASKPCVLGGSKLGLEMILGDQFSVLGYSHRITLIADDETINPNEQWHVCAKERLEKYIYPLLECLDLFLEVILVVRGSKQWLSLETNKISLGYERFKGQEDSVKSVVLHRGPIPN